MLWIHRFLGRDDASVLAVDPTHEAARIGERPLHLGSRGSYSVGVESGIIPAAVGSNVELFQWRWLSQTAYCVLRTVKISACVSLTPFGAGVPVGLEMRTANQWTGQGTGGTPFAQLGDDWKKRSRLPPSGLIGADIRIASTAALGAGTKVLSGVASRIVNGHPALAVTDIIKPATILWERDTSDGAAFYFKHSQGFVIRVIEVPPTGTWRLAVAVEWAEMDALGQDAPELWGG